MYERFGKGIMVVFGALLLAFLVAPIGAGAHGEWPWIKPEITATVKGDRVTYTLWLKNQTEDDRQHIDLKIKLPHGTRYVDSWAGVPFTNRGRFDSQAVSWYHGEVKAESREGPFVLVAKINPWDPKDPEETLVTWAWVRWSGGGAATSEVLVLQNPLKPAPPILEMDSLVHPGYLDVSSNITELRAQIGNWEQGIASGRTIAIEKVDRLKWLIPHTAWPPEMKEIVHELEHELEGVEKGLRAQDLAAVKKPLDEIRELSHDLTHAFYDKWLPAHRGMARHSSIHAAYLDIMSNAEDLSIQVGNWEKGTASGRTIGIEKVDRLRELLLHLQRPGEMKEALLALDEALDPIETGLRYSDLDMVKAALPKVSGATHDLTHGFYDKWIASQEGQTDHAITHLAYLDVSRNINDLRTQVGNWEKGVASGRTIAIEKVDRLNWIVQHVSWPPEMKVIIHELEHELEGVEKGLKAQDMATVQKPLEEVRELSHDLTHGFYDKWVASIPAEAHVPLVVRPMPPEAMPASPAAEMPAMPPAPPAAARPALDPALVAQGMTLYSSVGCAACHGASGQGGIGPSLTHWHDAEVIRDIVRMGRGMMPPFGMGQISDAELAALIAYIQSLAQ